MLFHNDVKKNSQNELHQFRRAYVTFFMLNIVTPKDLARRSVHFKFKYSLRPRTRPPFPTLQDLSLLLTSVEKNKLNNSHLLLFYVRLQALLQEEQPVSCFFCFVFLASSGFDNLKLIRRINDGAPG